LGCGPLLLSVIVRDGHPLSLSDTEEILCGPHVANY
jgi:hypothetical protein